MNRLKLDFSLQTAEERNQFLQTYLVQFDNLTEQELETIANYLLWGKVNGESLGKGIEIKTRNGTWDKKEKAESLEALLENPGFNDAQLQQLNEIPPIKIPKQNFSRSEARQNAPNFLLEIFERLWQRIDRLDLLLNYYDLKTGKRINEPRESLVKKFSEEERAQLKEKANKLNQYQYLKKRHELVELRREQYTLRDSYQESILVTQPHFYRPYMDGITFDSDVEIYPLGLKNNSEIGQLIFDLNFQPRALNEKQKRQGLNWIERKEQKKNPSSDFRNLEDVYQILMNWFDLLDQIERHKQVSDIYGNLEELVDTLKFYARAANLNQVQKRILKLKIQKVKNQEIADRVNKEFRKSYSANYISTVFRHKVIVKINEELKKICH